MIDSLHLSFEVACRAQHAFSIWTDRVSLWWPADHTMSQGPGVVVRIEPGVGGRIYERTGAGAEFDWGRVTVWEPPGRLVCRWHLATDPEHATEVEVTFAERSDGTTQVDIEHRGWEAFGDQAEERRDRNQAGWGGVVPLFRAACEGPSTLA